MTARLLNENVSYGVVVEVVQRYGLYVQRPFS